MGISQEELAERAGLHRTYVADIERGVRNPTLQSIQKLAQALRVSIRSLLPNGRAVAAASDMVDILLVEDDPADVNLTLHGFKKAHLNNRIHVARDGQAALDFFFSQQRNDNLPRLILLDLGLPKVRGLEVLRRLKSDARTRNIPVVVLTISDHGEDMLEARRLGADAYIIKPVDFQRFAQIVPQVDLNWVVCSSS